jgi:hypothetical protein
LGLSSTKLILESNIFWELLRDLGQTKLVGTGISNDGSETIKTIGSSSIPKLLLNSVSDNVSLGGLSGFVFSSELFKLCLVFGTWCFLALKLNCFSLESLERFNLSSLKLTSVLTDKRVGN